MFSSWTIFNCRFLLDILTQACTEWDLDSCSDSDSCIWICVQIQILGSLKSVNLFDGQFTCWAICLKYHILTYGHITAGPPENLSSPCCFHGCCNQKFSAHRDGLHCLLAAGLSSRCLPISGWAPAFGGLPFVAADSTSSSRPLRRSAVSATRPPGSNTPRSERRT